MGRETTAKRPAVDHFSFPTTHSCSRARVLHHGAYQRRHNAQPQLPTSNTGFHRREGTCRHCRLQKRGRRPEATTIDSATVGIELREEHVGARTCWTTKFYNARRQLTPCMSSWVSTRVSNRRSRDTGGQLRRGWHLERHGNLVRGQVFSSKNQLLLDF